MSDSWKRVETACLRLSKWCVIGFGFTIPVWTLADGILMALFVPIWLCSGDWARKFARIHESPVALSTLAFVGLLALGTLWGLGGVGDRALGFKKYCELLFIPVVISMALSVEDKHRALMAFAASMTVILALSFCMAGGLLPTKGLIKGIPLDPVVFKRHITHNVLMAFAALLFAAQAWWARTDRWRWVWGGLAALAAVNVVVMVQGRTGQVVLAALGCVALHRLLQWKGVILALLIAGGTSVVVYATVPHFHQLVHDTVDGVMAWNPHAVGRPSIGERLEFFYHTASIIQAHPIIGVGTGGFVEAYAEQVKGTPFLVTIHPHNQYLLTTAQLGIIGLVTLCWLFIQQWCSSFYLMDDMHGILARGLVITIAIGCLFNSFLNDHTEKLFFAWTAGILFSPSSPPSETVA